MDKNDEIIAFEKKLSISGNNENDIQKYLEDKTFLIPLPFLLNHRLHFNFIFKKFTLPNGRITDFLYITKSTVQWQIVLIEIESSNKKIFTTSGQSFYFHSKFNNAYDQIMTWKSYLDENKDTFKKEFEPLMGHMFSNPISFKYLLIIGRNNELDTNEKRGMFNQKNTENIRVMTYDSLISNFQAMPLGKKILVKKKVNGYEILNLPDIGIPAFAYLNKSQLSFDQKIRNELIKRGYSIEEWEKGKYLEVNNKYTYDSFRDKLIG